MNVCVCVTVLRIRKTATQTQTFTNFLENVIPSFVERDANFQGFQGFQLYLLLTGIAFAAFLVSLDGFIVNVAVPPISGELGVPEDVGTWIITVFTIASTVCVPLAGSLSLRFGNFRVFIFGILFFGAASLFSGFAHSFNMLLLGRILQGCAAGLITPISLALIVHNFPPEKRGIGIGFWNFFVIVGPAMGPMIGGWLADYRWPWMFFLNLPIVIFSALIVWLFLKDKKDKRYPAPWILSAWLCFSSASEHCSLLLIVGYSMIGSALPLSSCCLLCQGFVWFFFSFGSGFIPPLLLVTLSS